MANNYLKPQLTTDGIAMIVKAMNGDSIIFTKMVLGNGVQTLAPRNVKELVNPIMEVPFTNATYGDTHVILTAYTTSRDINDGFFATEMGIYAKESEGADEVLYAYRFQEENADYYPENNSDAVLEIYTTIVVEIGEAEKVSAIITENDAYASKQEFTNHLKDENNPHKVSKRDIGLENYESEFGENTVNFESAENVAEITKGEKLSSMIGKISALIKGFMNHTNAKNPHKITYDAIGAAKSQHTHSAKDINTGILAISAGGTGVSTLEELKIKLGLDKVTIHPLGTWEFEKDYKTLDLVSYQGSAYVAVKNVPVQTSIFNTAYWMCLVDVSEIRSDLDTAKIGGHTLVFENDGSVRWM